MRSGRPASFVTTKDIDALAELVQARTIDKRQPQCDIHESFRSAICMCLVTDKLTGGFESLFPIPHTHHLSNLLLTQRQA